MKKNRKKKFYMLFFQFSWVVFYILLILTLYEKEMKTLKDGHASLAKDYKDLELKLFEAKELNKELNIQLKSYSDPEWLELVLMKNLGVVPEGYEKILIDKRCYGR